MKRKSGIIIVLCLLLTMACMVVPPPALAWEDWSAATTGDPNHTWTVVFKQAMDTSTVNNQNVYVSVESTGSSRVSGVAVVAPDNTHALISPPAGGWKAGTKYYLIITQKVLTDEGTPLKDAVRMPFRIITSSEQQINKSFTQGAGYQAGAYDYKAIQPTICNWSGQSSYAGPSEPVLKWTFSDEEIESSVVIGNDATLYAGCKKDGKICAINPDGTKKWVLRTTSPKAEDNQWFPTLVPSIGSDGTLYFGNPYGRTFAVDPNTKAIKWILNVSLNNDTSFQSTPVLASDGTVYVGSSHTDSAFYALTSKGNKKWKFSASSGVSTPAIGSDGTIYTSSHEKAYALKPDGSVKWTYNINENKIKDYFQMPWLSSPSIGPNGTIYFSSGNKFYAFNPDGTKKWELPINSDVVSPSVASDGTIYAAGYKGLFAITPEGAQKWWFSTCGQVDSMPIIGADGTIYISGYSGVYAVNQDGTQKWLYSIKREGNSNPVTIDKDGILYYVTGGKVYALSNNNAGR